MRESVYTTHGCTVHLVLVRAEVLRVQPAQDSDWEILRDWVLEVGTRRTKKKRVSA